MVTVTAARDSLCWIFGAGVMALLLALGALTALQPKLPQASYVEQRSLAAFPAATWETIADARYVRALDSFVNDHVFGRDWGLWLYERVAPHWRKDWIYGADSWVFSRFVAETDTAYRSGRGDEIEAALRRLAAIARHDGKLLVVERYPNKSFVYRDKLPARWQRYIPAAREDVPYYRAAARLQQEGLLLLADHTAVLQRLRAEGGEAFSMWFETHPSGDGLFRANQELVGAIAAALGRTVALPADFPKTRIEPNGIGWAGSFRFAPSVAPVENVALEIYALNLEDVAERIQLKDLAAYRGPLPGFLARYRNPSGNAAPLPAAFVVSDSYFYHGIRSVSPSILPYFAAVTVHFNDMRTDGWDEAAVVVLSHSEQSAPGLATKLNGLADRLERRARR
jgi:hypothetical protein